MFKKLKRKFILTNLLTSTIVLLVAFSAIYFIALGSSKNRAPRPFEWQDAHSEMNPAAQANQNTQNPEPTQESQSTGQQNMLRNTENAELDNYLKEQLDAERQASLNTLLISLIVTGVAMEAVIAVISIYLAEQSVKPVREAYLAQKTFVANASHEIKTPLAVIQANLEAADIKGNQWLDNVEKKVEDLSRLNNQLLALARMDSIKSEAKLEKCNLKETVENVISSYLPQIKKKGIKLKLHLENNLEKSINRTDFVQLINILIDNAIKYSKSKISITLDHKSFRIKNDGATIKKADLDHIFDRFYQTDKTSSGVGLGLAIGESLAQNNGWKLTAASDSSSTTFSIIYD
ncbi:HAMP domain-containing histidine kinase [Candidatus Saccharibacteria bacterium]|nr:HAMP domain-containing histidine kinase [Candidatus Saccharibacteria bacterium]